MIADEIAQNMGYADFYSLCPDDQIRVFLKAEEMYFDKKMMEAEDMNDRLAGF